ncbi:MAG: hypothetical protein N3A58_06475 [Spirochaetes bacterium]|nr:hypothetical protein [Spirochaetota bacterium]
MDNQLYFDFEKNSTDYFVIGRFYDLKKLLHLYIKGIKIINLIGKKGIGKTFFVLKFIQIYRSFFQKSSVFYFNLKNYYYHDINEILFDFKIFIINSEKKDNILLILDNFLDSLVTEEFKNLIESYENLKLLIVSNKKSKYFKNKYFLSPLKKLDFREFLSIYAGYNKLIYKYFIYFYSKYKKNIGISIRFLKILYEKNISLDEKDNISNILQYLNFYYFNKDNFFLYQIFSFLPEVSEEFIFSLSFFISSNQNQLRIFNIFSYDDFIKILNKFFYENYNILSRNGKNYYICKNRKLFNVLENFILKNEMNLIEDFLYNFYKCRNEEIIHFDVFLKKFKNSVKFYELAFNKISFFFKIKNNDNVFRIINNIEEKNVPSNYILRYLLIKGNVYFFNKSYSEALYYFKKILQKKKGDPYLRETLILKIGYIKNYLGETDEAIEIIKEVINKSLLGGDYRKYALLTIGEIFYSKNNFKEALIYFLLILKDIVTYLCYRSKENCNHLSLSFEKISIEQTKIINCGDLAIQNILNQNFNLYEMIKVIRENIDYFFETEENRNFYVKLIKDIGICSLYLELFDFSKSMFLLALDLCKKEDLLYGVILNDLGVLHKKFGYNGKAYYYYLKAYDKFKSLNSDARIAMVTNNLASLLMGFKNFDKALEYLNISYEIKKKYNDLKQLGVAYVNYGIIYYHMNAIEQSYNFLNLAYDAFSKSNDNNHLVITHFYILMIEIFYYSTLKKKFDLNYYKNSFESFIIEFEKSSKYYQVLFDFLKFIFLKKFNLIYHDSLIDINKNSEEIDKFLKNYNDQFVISYKNLKDMELKILIGDLIKIHKVGINIIK